MHDSGVRSRSVFLFLTMMLLFSLSLKGMLLSYYPVTGRKVLSVTIEQRGAWQDQIENFITNPLEEELLQMEGIRSVITSYSIHYTKLYDRDPAWLSGKDQIILSVIAA